MVRNNYLVLKWVLRNPGICPGTTQVLQKGFWVSLLLEGLIINGGTYNWDRNYVTRYLPTLVTEVEVITNWACNQKVFFINKLCEKCELNNYMCSFSIFCCCRNACLPRVWGIVGCQGTRNWAHSERSMLWILLTLPHNTKEVGGVAQTFCYFFAFTVRREQTIDPW